MRALGTAKGEPKRSHHSAGKGHRTKFRPSSHLPQAPLTVTNRELIQRPETTACAQITQPAVVWVQNTSLLFPEGLINICTLAIIITGNLSLKFIKN